VNGWTFNGTNQWLDTLFIPAITQAQSMLIQFTGVAGPWNINAICGVQTGGGNFAVYPNYAANRVEYTNGVASIGVFPQLGAGNLGVGGNQGYRNGIAEGGALPGWGAGGPFSVYIGCWNQVGVPARFIANNTQALALYTCTLTAPQMAAIAANMAAL